ncbi:hypothetical protein CCUS01_08273 [Colletotrichum cuscutae]|uniref:Uncharacterized protein n=1 Tax=Colletotrichum cuscutae TaxID=1209917 RepID=A0AAI9UV18_9PEZI|nr:hypothetical protein CCUS01_08273 [Colletotrichum cuscutae]
MRKAYRPWKEVMMYTKNESGVRLLLLVNWVDNELLLYAKVEAGDRWDRQAGWEFKKASDWGRKQWEAWETIGFGMREAETQVPTYASKRHHPWKMATQRRRGTTLTGANGADFRFTTRKEGGGTNCRGDPFLRTCLSARTRRSRGQAGRIGRSCQLQPTVVFLKELRTSLTCGPFWYYPQDTPYLHISVASFCWTCMKTRLHTWLHSCGLEKLFVPLLRPISCSDLPCFFLQIPANLHSTGEALSTTGMMITQDFLDSSTSIPSKEKEKAARSGEAKELPDIHITTIQLNAISQRSISFFQLFGLYSLINGVSGNASRMVPNEGETDSHIWIRRTSARLWTFRPSTTDAGLAGPFFSSSFSLLAFLASFPVTTSSEEPRRGGGKGLLLGTWKNGEWTKKRHFHPWLMQERGANAAGTGTTAQPWKHRAPRIRRSIRPRLVSFDPLPCLSPQPPGPLLHPTQLKAQNVHTSYISLTALSVPPLLLQKNPSLFASNTKSLFSNIVIVALAPAPSPPSVDLHRPWLSHSKSPAPAITRETLSQDIAARESPFVVSPALAQRVTFPGEGGGTDEALRLNSPSWHGEWLHAQYVSDEQRMTTNRPNPSRLLRIHVSTIRPALLTRFTTLGWPHVVVVLTLLRLFLFTASRLPREMESPRGIPRLFDSPDPKAPARIPSIRAPFHSNTTPILALYFHMFGPFLTAAHIPRPPMRPAAIEQDFPGLHCATPKLEPRNVTGSMTRDCHAGRCPPSGHLPGSLLLQRLKPTSIARDSEPRPAQGPTISGHEALLLNSTIHHDVRNHFGTASRLIVTHRPRGSPSERTHCFHPIAKRIRKDLCFHNSHFMVTLASSYGESGAFLPDICLTPLQLPYISSRIGLFLSAAVDYMQIIPSISQLKDGGSLKVDSKETRHTSCQVNYTGFLFNKRVPEKHFYRQELDATQLLGINMVSTEFVVSSKWIKRSSKVEHGNLFRSVRSEEAQFSASPTSSAARRTEAALNHSSHQSPDAVVHTASEMQTSQRLI